MHYATIIGIMALIMWSFGPLFNTFVAAVPLFEILTFSFGIAFIFGILQLFLTRRLGKLKQPFLFSVIGFLGVIGSELLFVSAFKYAPPTHITLLNYLWPVYVIYLSWVVGKGTFSIRYGIAVCIGFASVAFYILNEVNFVIQPQYWIGYTAAVLGSSFWSIYIIFNRNQRDMPVEMITLYCGIGCFIALNIHCKIETFYIPTTAEMFALLWLGLIGMGLAFKCWDFGIKYGNPFTLSILSFYNVLFATIFLILFDQATFNLRLLIAIMGVIAASLIIFGNDETLENNSQLRIRSKNKT